MPDIVFEGDEFTRGKTRSGDVEVVARSAVAEYLLRRRFVKSERQARWIAASIALISVFLVVASATWATRALSATPSTKSFAEMNEAERRQLPVKHRLYLERVEQQRQEARDQRIRDQFRTD